MIRQVLLYEDELYPFYSLVSIQGGNIGIPIIVTEEFYKKYQKVMEEFYGIQDELEKIMNDINKEVKDD